jgi:DNA-binding transcriptional LysR family regulator
VAPKIVRSYANVEMIKSAVEANLGLAFLPSDLLKTDERLRTIQVRGLTFHRPLAAVVRGRRADDPLIVSFIAALQRHFSNI